MEVVGIVGAGGDLGSRITVQACSVFEDVRIFDTSQTLKTTLIGINPALKTSTVQNEPQTLKSLDEVLDACSIIHWVAPIESAKAIPRLPKSSMLVLHDSVMANSVEAARKLRSNKAVEGQVAVAHCLTNEELTVVIASEVGDTGRLSNHVNELGLRPKLMSTKEHDLVMAHSQAVFAIICKIYHQELEDYARDGLLTPSGQRLLTAIEDNESHWTSTTFAAIVSNPEIGSVIESMTEVIK
jgi:prephenate dehydrogenase